MAVYLEEFVESIENLPAEIRHHMQEIRSRDDEILELRRQIFSMQKSHLSTLSKRQSGTLPPAVAGSSNDSLMNGTAQFFPGGSSSDGGGQRNGEGGGGQSLQQQIVSDATVQQIRQKYAQARTLSDEKILLTERALELINKHLKRLNDTVNNAVKEAAANGGSSVDPALLEASILGSTSVYDHQSPRVNRRARNVGQSSSKNQKKKKRKSYSYDDDEGDDDDDEEGSIGDSYAAVNDQNEYGQDAELDQDQLYCICQQGSFGDMIECDNAGNCPYGWFHYECVGLTLGQPPHGLWYCPSCSSKSQ
ncbi:hypothetical protein MP228_011393 [Amoeboaphelidium protococcarum]|nr:hypothetical protein MP228_011393 [Amoeboaphelidium protococcarum]